MLIDSAVYNVRSWLQSGHETHPRRFEWRKELPMKTAPFLRSMMEISSLTELKTKAKANFLITCFLQQILTNRRCDNLLSMRLVTFDPKKKSSKHINMGSSFEGLVVTNLLCENGFSIRVTVRATKHFEFLNSMESMLTSLFSSYMHACNNWGQESVWVFMFFQRNQPHACKTRPVLLLMFRTVGY